MNAGITAAEARMLHDLGAILIDPATKRPLHKWKDRTVRARHATPAAIRRHVAKGGPVAISPCDAGSARSTWTAARSPTCSTTGTAHPGAWSGRAARAATTCGGGSPGR